MQKIKTEVLVNAGVEKAWNDYTDPEIIKGWAFASDDWECPYAENDLKIGGRFVTRMSAKDKSSGFDFAGTYTEVKEFKKIAYMMDRTSSEISARECEITFEDLGSNQTKVMVVFDSEDENPIEMQKNGWQSILHNFKKFTEKN